MLIFFCLCLYAVAISYGEQTVLKDVSVSLEKGKIHGLVGRNGSGKTVLMKCICGLTYQDQGEILFPGCLGKTRPSMGIIIEEPFNGLDQSGVEKMRALFQEKAASGVTILLASHHGEDIDHLCDTVHRMESGVMTPLIPAG